MRLLFVCVGNTCRSQMAEAIARKMGHEAMSAGTKPPENKGVAELAIEVLMEIGISTEGLHPKSIETIIPSDFNMIISMGCGVSCPSIPIDRDWGLEDPHGHDIDFYRVIRDKIREKLQMLS